MRPLYIIAAFFAAIAFGEDAVITEDDGNDFNVTGKNYEELYEATREAYLANDWPACVTLANAALDDFHFYHAAVTECKRACRKEAEVDMRDPARALNARADVDDLLFYEKLTRATLCLMRCKEEKFGPDRVEQVSHKTKEDFHNKAVYNYLQMCYHQVF